MGNQVDKRLKIEQPSGIDLTTPLCHSSSATAATECDRGARGMTSAGGGRGAARAASQRPSVDAWAIDATTATPPWQWRQPNATRRPLTWCRRQSNAISVPGDRRARGGGGVRGRPHRNASAARRGARRTSTPPLPLPNGGKHTRSRRHQGNDEPRGGGRAGGPRRNAADATRRHACHRRGVKKMKKWLTWEWWRAGEDNGYGG